MLFRSESIFSLTEQYSFFGSIQGIGIKASFFVATVEEVCKFIMLRYYAYRKPEFDEPFDGIVYAVMVGMGFATLENIFYVSQFGMVTGIFRMFFAVPAHATFAILMGYFMGKAKFSVGREKKLMWAGLFWAILFHGSYDFFLFLQENKMVVKTLPSFLLTMGAIVSLIIGIILSNKAIKSHLEFSKSNHHKFNVYDN